MTDPTPVLCVLGSQPHRATTGYVCEQHLQRFADTLRDIETEYALISAVPSMQVRSGRGASLASQRSPAVLDAIVATDHRRGTGHVGSDYEDPWGLDDTASVLDVLHSWGRVVREERQLANPTRVVRTRMASKPYVGPFCQDCQHSSCDRMTFWLELDVPPTVSSERDVLSRSLNWVAHQEWVDEAYSELQALLGQLKATNGTAAAKASARCHLPAVDGPCNGPIRVNEVDGYAYCGDCRETWTSEQARDVIELAHELSRPRTEDGRAMMTVQQIVAAFGLKANAVRVRLSRAGIKGVDGYYDAAVFEGVVA